MNQLGSQVLQKIETLLTKIDLTNEVSRRLEDKSKREEKYQLKTHQIPTVLSAVSNELPLSVETALPNPLSAKLPTLAPKISIPKLILKPSSSGTDYYQLQYQYMKNLQNRAKQTKTILYQQVQQYPQFKVTNPRSIQLNAHTNRKPIHQRTPDILQHKHLSTQRIKQQLQVSKLISIDSTRFPNSTLHQKNHLEYLNKLHSKQLQSCFDVNLANSIIKSTKSQSKLNIFLKQLQQQNRARINRKNQQKLRRILKQDVYDGIPHINKSSKKLHSIRKLRKNHSDNVFVRLQEQHQEKLRHNDEYSQTRKKQQTPFRPELSNRSRVIVKQVRNRKNLLEISQNNQSNSRHLKCIQSFYNILTPVRVKKNTSRSLQNGRHEHTIKVENCCQETKIVNKIETPQTTIRNKENHQLRAHRTPKPQTKKT